MDAEHPAITTSEQALQKVSDFLFDEKRVRFIFDPPMAARAGLFPEAAGDETGRLVRSFSFIKLHQFLGLGEVSEDKILEVLDVLASQRKVRIFSVKIPPNNRFDLYFVAEVGIGLFGFRPPKTITGSALLKIIFYRDKPTTESGRILCPSTRAAFVRAERDRDFESRFPKIDAELQSRIMSEERQSKQAFENAVLEMVERIDKKLDKLKI